MAFEPRSEQRRGETLRIWAAAEAKDRAQRVAFMHGVQCPTLSRQGMRTMDESLDVDTKQDRPSLALERLEQLKRDLLIHIKSVPELRRDTAIIRP